MIIMIFEGYELGYLDLKALKVTTSTYLWGHNLGKVSYKVTLPS